MATGIELGEIDSVINGFLIPFLEKGRNCEDPLEVRRTETTDIMKGYNEQTRSAIMKSRTAPIDSQPTKRVYCFSEATRKAVNDFERGAVKATDGLNKLIGRYAEEENNATFYIVSEHDFDEEGNLAKIIKAFRSVYENARHNPPVVIFVGESIDSIGSNKSWIPVLEAASENCGICVFCKSDEIGFVINMFLIPQMEGEQMKTIVNQNFDLFPDGSFIFFSKDGTNILGAETEVKDREIIGPVLTVGKARDAKALSGFPAEKFRAEKKDASENKNSRYSPFVLHGTGKVENSEPLYERVVTLHDFVFENVEIDHKFGSFLIPSHTLSSILENLAKPYYKDSESLDVTKAYEGAEIDEEAFAGAEFSIWVSLNIFLVPN